MNDLELDELAEPGLSCPKCGGASVVERPGNKISDTPSFQCADCKRRLRAPGTRFFDIFILLLGVGFAVGMTLLFLSKQEQEQEQEQAVKALYYGAVGVIIAVYAIVQLLRPTVRVRPSDQSFVRSIR